MPADEPAAKRLLGALRLRWALALVWRSAPGWTVAQLVLVALQGALPVREISPPEDIAYLPSLCDHVPADLTQIEKTP